MIIGIDLGTTNSLVSYFKDGKWLLIPNEFGNFKTPSVISFDEASYTVGDVARQRMVTHPATTFSVFKRSMGSEDNFVVNNTRYTAQDLSGLLIKYLVKQAETFLNTTVNEAVITVPAYFDDMQRHATKAAGALAGIKVDRIINEPSAAALAYYLQRKEEGYSLVFDFGGGTLDISVVDIFDDIVDVISIVGDVKLGGVDIDSAIANYHANQHADLKRMTKDQFQQLQLVAEETKVKLSTSDSVDLVFNYKNKSYTTSFTNQLLTEICLPILERIKGLVEISLKDAQISGSELNCAICVGGSSNVLFVRQYLKRLLGVDALIDINPEEAVAIGAGIVASIKSREPSVSHILLTDVSPFSLGVSLIDDKFGIIIPKNATLPISRTSSYTTTADNQKIINFCVIQGNSPIASRNKQIGKPLAVPVEKAPAGVPQVLISFSYDINGLLEIEWKSSVSEDSVTVITNPNLDQEWIEKQRMKLDSIKQKTIANPKFDLLLSRADAIHRHASPQQQETLIKAMQKFIEISEMQKPTILARAIDKFEQYLNQYDKSQSVLSFLDFDVDTSIKH